MVKYILKSNAFEGVVTFGFANGFLVHFSNESTMNELQVRWLFTNFPFTTDSLESIRDKIHGKLELVPADLSFDAFWETYGKKVNRKRCEPLWKKLSDAERLTCLTSIPHYKSYLKRTGFRAQMDPENYLKKESFQNPWNSLTS
jgi:hypothetical protein